MPSCEQAQRKIIPLSIIDFTNMALQNVLESTYKEDDNPNYMVYKKMEAILEAMQDPNNGIVVKTVKSFMSKIPSVFAGADLISWMMKNLVIDDTTEALHLANLLGAYGYIFPIDDHMLTIKNDGAYYRFQTPCFWPSRCIEPENTDYAVYLCKRTMQNKQRLELVDYEAENLARLQKTFSRKWEFIFIQAEAQAKVDKKRDKLERKVLDSQERAFWDVHRPAPGCVNTTEIDIKKTCRNIKTPRHLFKGQYLKLAAGEIIPESEASNLIELINKKFEWLKRLTERRRIKISKVAESYITFYDQYVEFDPFISTTEPSNPWISDNTDYWDQENSMKDIPQRRVKRWGFSVRELLKDSAGREHFRKFLEKEFSAENLKFWEECQMLKFSSNKLVNIKIQDMYNIYLSSGAMEAINVDCKVAEAVAAKVKDNPNRYCFSEAEEHIYQLMKNDSYNRYLRSEMYKEFLNGSKKKSKRSFATEVRRLRELTRSQNPSEQKSTPTHPSMASIVAMARAAKQKGSKPAGLTSAISQEKLPISCPSSPKQFLNKKTSIEDQGADSTMDSKSRRASVEFIYGADNVSILIPQITIDEVVDKPGDDYIKS